MDVRGKAKNDKRLIDANAFLKDILTAGIGKTIIEYSESDIGYMIRKRPTVDAVEVVRCRDCKYFHTETVEEQTPYGFTNDKKVCGCMLRGEWVDVFIDDFCSYGERKEK